MSGGREELLPPYRSESVLCRPEKAFLNPKVRLSSGRGPCAWWGSWKGRRSLPGPGAGPPCALPVTQDTSGDSAKTPGRTAPAASQAPLGSLARFSVLNTK